MATESLNPFADYGTIIVGSRFIGRKEEIQIINQRVMGDDYGNIAIVGLPRIGKSSLAWHCIMEKKEDLEKSKCIPIFLTVSKYCNVISFFREFVSSVDAELDFLCEDERYEKYVKPILINILNGDCGEELSSMVTKYFRFVKRLGYKVIAILDEFDAAINLFTKSDFQVLRALSYEPDTKVCLVTTSRKTIEDIERLSKDGAISNFAGVCSMLRLTGYSEDDLHEYWEKRNADWQVGEDYVAELTYYAGGHPWLMDMINYKACVKHVRDASFLGQFDEVKLELMESFDNMANTLRDEGLLEPTIQLVVGPMFDVPAKQEEKLLKYGFIKKVETSEKEEIFGGIRIGPSFESKSYICFSEYCTLDLYRRYYANVPYFSVWSDTENLLRSVVVDYLKTNYSPDWEHDFRNKLSSFPNIDLSKWDENMSKLKKNAQNMWSRFPKGEKKHLVEYSLTSQLFSLFIRADWDWFGTRIFPGDKKNWFEKFNFLTNLRDPVAHNNSIDLEEYKRVARDYCKEISTAIHEWQKKK